MSRHTIFCKHFQSMSDHESCKAGVVYLSLKPIPFEQRPCFCKPGKEPNAGCDLAEFPTAEELAAEEAEWAERFDNTRKARQAIVAHLGGTWKRGMGSVSGQVDCPMCGGTLRFTRSGYNGHIHAACMTDDCVSWME